MESRPTTGFILTLLGGLFILMGILVALAYPPLTSYPYYTIPTYYYPLLITSAVCGLLVLAMAVLLYWRPEFHVAWGVIALVLSVASSVGIITGFFALFGAIGIVFGIIGGSLALAWRSAGWSPSMPANAVRMCSGCGRYIPLAYPYCAFCGTPAPMFQRSGPSHEPPGSRNP